MTIRARRVAAASLVAVVVVEGDRVTGVGTGTVAIPKGAKVIDLRRYTALPGLIDVHTT